MPGTRHSTANTWRLMWKILSLPWTTTMSSGRQRDTFAKLEFSVPTCFLSSSYIWPGTSSLMFWCQGRWSKSWNQSFPRFCNSLRTWKTLRRLQSMSFCLLKLYVTLVVHPTIWVFLSQNKEEANWLDNSSRFYSAFDISGNFLSGLYDSLLVSIFTGSLQSPTQWSCP